VGKKVGIGIVGFGNWPRTAYVPVLRDLDGAEVVAVAARSERTLSAARETFGGDLSVYRNYRELLSDPRVDAVIVATPNALHEEVATAALRAGKHVFVEPPFGDSADQAFRLLDQADEIRQTAQPPLVFQGDLELGYIPALHRVRELMNDGTLGRPVSVSVKLWCDWGFGGKSASDESARIGLFVWLGPWYLHVLDVLIGHLPERAQADGVRAMNGDLIDCGWASLAYEDSDGDELIGRFEFNLLAVEGQDIFVEVVGTRGESQADLTSGEVRWRTVDTSGWRTDRIAPAEPIVAFAGMRECLAGFVRAAAVGGSVLADLAACRRTHQVAFAAQRAADERVIVELSGA